MNTMRALVAATLAALATACAGPGPAGGGGASSGDAQAAHHPDAVTAMEPRMKSMQAMHQKLASAKSPAEREALMAEHMKAMQGGMDMMKEMRGMGGNPMPSGMGDRDQMMADHTAMMQMMMAMMADRMPPDATAR